MSREGIYVFEAAESSKKRTTALCTRLEGRLKTGVGILEVNYRQQGEAGQHREGQKRGSARKRKRKAKG